MIRSILMTASYRLNVRPTSSKETEHRQTVCLFKIEKQFIVKAMHINVTKRLDTRWQRAFSLVEIMVAIAVIGISFVSLYAGITSGVQVIQLSRENLRATQILVEKMETLRIKTWEQITNGVDVPRTFTDDFYPLGTGSKGISYYGTLAVTPIELWTNYDDDMRMVTVSLRWTNANVPRLRIMRTYIARNGMQNYVF